MHDTKVNTNNSDGTSADGKNDLPVQYVDRIDVPFEGQYIRHMAGGQK